MFTILVNVNLIENHLLCQKNRFKKGDFKKYSPIYGKKGIKMLFF